MGNWSQGKFPFYSICKIEKVKRKMKVCFTMIPLNITSVVKYYIIILFVSNILT